MGRGKRRRLQGHPLILITVSYFAKDMILGLCKTFNAPVLLLTLATSFPIAWFFRRELVLVPRVYAVQIELVQL